MKKSGTSISWKKPPRITTIPKTLDTLVEDIYALFDPEKTHEPSEENLEVVATNIKDILRLRLREREPINNPLRFSALGKPDRQIWYAAQGTKSEDLTAKTYFKFLYGDIIEQLVLFLCKEAGHKVEREQEEVEVDGVLGHIDAIIDDVVVDVKSASPYGYKKFKDNDIVQDDPFGYIPQISGYSNVLTPGQAPAFLAFDKVAGDICVTPVSTSITNEHKPEDRIAHLREVIELPEPPPRCYDDVPDGKSGNRKLVAGCSFCGFKNSCWPNLRAFAYSTGPRYLTHVAKLPDVPEFNIAS